VAFQGELGAYSEEALESMWPSGVEPVPFRECLDVAGAVERGDVDAGLLPIENTLAGSVVASYDALAVSPRLHVTAEVVTPIHHCILAPRGARLEEIQTVESHPVALAQCGRFLRAHPRLRALAAYDTAGAARDVAARNDPCAAAIAGRAAAHRYGLCVIAADIEDRPDNQTRFLAIERAPRSLPKGADARTGLLVTTANVSGALVRVLTPIAEHGLNMSKLESRPTGEPWRYRFFIEIDHAAGDPAADRALADVAQVTESLRVLGTYARSTA